MSPKAVWLRHGMIGVALVLAAASCAPGTDGILIADASAQEIDLDTAVDRSTVLVELPTVPVVRLPAISAAGEYDELLQQRLGALASRPLHGVELVNVQCEDGEIVRSGDHTSDVFAGIQRGYGESFSFEIDADGSATYVRDTNTGTTNIRTAPDGSGVYVEDGPWRTLSIAMAADGSGEYFNKARNGFTTTVQANADGSGVFYRSSRTTLLTITLFADGAGQLYSDGDGQKITIDAAADGAGEMFYERDGRTVTVLVEPSGAWQVQDAAFGHAISVKVNPDGSGQYRERGTARPMTLDFASDGTTTGPRVVLPATPRFVVTDSFPALGSLATITPPCATVVRFDSAVFFEVDKAQVLPQGLALLAEVAPALIEADLGFEIHGHTDATGGDEYNRDLSLRRAEAVAAELRSLGVTTGFTVYGQGESQPIAPNYRADGSDDEAGQSQNRRVELVING